MVRKQKTSMRVFTNEDDSPEGCLTPGFFATHCERDRKAFAAASTIPPSEFRGFPAYAFPLAFPNTATLERRKQIYITDHAFVLVPEAAVCGGHTPPAPPVRSSRIPAPENF